MRVKVICPNLSYEGRIYPKGSELDITEGTTLAYALNRGLVTEVKKFAEIELPPMMPFDEPPLEPPSEPEPIGEEVKLPPLPARKKNKHLQGNSSRG